MRGPPIPIGDFPSHECAECLKHIFVFLLPSRGRISRSTWMPRGTMGDRRGHERFSRGPGLAWALGRIVPNWALTRNTFIYFLSGLFYRRSLGRKVPCGCERHRPEHTIWYFSVYSSDEISFANAYRRCPKWHRSARYVLRALEEAPCSGEVDDYHRLVSFDAAHTGTAGRGSGGASDSCGRR